MVDNSINNRQAHRYAVPVILICCGGLLVFSGLDFRDLQSWLRDTGHWAPLAFVLAGVLSMTVMVPKTIVSLSAGALFGTALGSLLMLIIAVSAAALNYSIARWWLYDSISRKLSKTQHNGAVWIRAIRELAADAGFRFHFLVRLTPIPTTLISYMMGASGSTMRPFLLAAAVAVIPQMLWVHGGTAMKMIDDPNVSGLRWLGVIVSVFAAITIGVIVPGEAMKRVHELRTRNENTSGVTD